MSQEMQLEAGENTVNTNIMLGENVYKVDLPSVDKSDDFLKNVIDLVEFCMNETISKRLIKNISDDSLLTFKLGLNSLKLFLIYLIDAYACSEEHTIHKFDITSPLNIELPDLFSGNCSIVAISNSVRSLIEKSIVFIDESIMLGLITPLNLNFVKMAISLSLATMVPSSEINDLTPIPQGIRTICTRKEAFQDSEKTLKISP